MKTLFAYMLLATVPFPEAQCQRLRVAISISDSAAQGIFASAFSSAFRSLGDVDVVAATEKPTYVLEGVVLCNPRDCSAAESYSLSLRFFTPFTEGMARSLAGTIVPMGTAAVRARRVDSTAAWLSFWLGRYERSLMTWSASWGRLRYEQAVREFVGRIDALCLEKTRAFNRAQVSKDTSSDTAFRSFVSSRDDWIC